MSQTFFPATVPQELITDDGRELDWRAALLRFNNIAKGAYARNSIRAHGSDWRVWTAWCGEQSIDWLPVSLDEIHGFLQDCIARGRKRATIDRYVATLALAHRAAGLPFPLDDAEGRLVLRTIHRDERLELRQKQAAGLTWDHIKKILSKLDISKSKDARDGALLCLGYDMQARMSELTVLRWDQLTERLADGSGRVIIKRSKTDQEGRGEWLYVAPATMTWLESWYELAELWEGLIFRSCPRSNKPNRFDKRLGERDVPRILKRLAALGGLDIKNVVSGHSLRVGKTQDMVAANYSMAEIMQAGRWKSARMPARYTEMLDAGRGAASGLAKKQGRANDDA